MKLAAESCDTGLMPTGSEWIAAGLCVLLIVCMVSMVAAFIWAVKR